jgi:hypothetical protein
MHADRAVLPAVWLVHVSSDELRDGAELEIDDKIYLATTRPHLGGLRWWFVCPRSNRRVRKLYLPLGWASHSK